MGGDEFLILLPNVDRAGAEKVGQKIQAAVSDYTGLTADGIPVPLSVSFGAGEIRRDEIDKDTETSLRLLIERAELGARGLHAARSDRRR